jgi:hypothetical protein
MAQCLPSQPKRPGSETSSVIIGQAQASAAQLRSEDAILFHQVRQRLSLLTIQPADQDREPHLESRHVEHGANLYHKAEAWRDRAPSIEMWDSSGVKETRR